MRAERRIFFRDARALAEREGFALELDIWLMEENAGLVEWPVVLMGHINERFMDLPAEVLRSAMRAHQRYFTLNDEAERPAPRFVMVSNIDAGDGAAVVAGNERVLSARLADARFFWDFDRRQRLAERVPHLKGIVFHARLGSMADKAQRIALLARKLCRFVERADPETAARAGTLAKADLVTQMVGEFPDLQGVMGRYYAEADEEAPEVWLAIRDHYSPQGREDSCPTLPVSVAVALADKLDTLVGFFAIDGRPTGSKDPFALRRTALGVIWLIMENGLRMSLADSLNDALAGYGDTLPEEPGPEATRDALLAFFADRVRVHLRELGYRHDHINAVFDAGSEDDLVRLRDRVDALLGFLNGRDGANLLTAYRRAANILRIEEKKDSERYDGEADPNLFEQAEEFGLRDSIAKANAHAMVMLGGEHFEEAMEIMATLREPVDAFFDNVTVNCEDPALRRNRLLMLSQIRSTLDRVADFSKIEG